MATVIRPNTSFVDQSSRLNQQLMQQNRDNVARATQQWKIARAEQDAVGMANARNKLEGKGFLSQHFGIGGKYNRPYNSQNLSQDADRGTQSNAQSFQPSERSVGLQKERDGLISGFEKRKQSEVQGRQDRSRLAGSQWEAGGVAPGMIQGNPATRNTDMPLSAENIYEDDYAQKLKAQTDAKVAGILDNGDPNAPDLQNINNVLANREQQTVVQPSKDEEAIAKVDHKIKIEDRREQVRRASKQEKGQLRQGWERLKRIDPNQMTGNYGQDRATMMNTGMDAINAMPINSMQDYRKVTGEFQKLKSQVFRLNAFFGLQGKDGNMRLSEFGIQPYKAPKGGGRRTKLENSVIDIDGEAVAFKLDKNSPNDSGENFKTIVRNLNNRKIFPPRGSTKAEKLAFYKDKASQVRGAKTSHGEMSDRDQRIAKEVGITARDDMLDSMNGMSKKDSYQAMIQHNKDFPKYKIDKPRFDSWGIGGKEIPTEDIARLRGKKKSTVANNKTRNIEDLL